MTDFNLIESLFGQLLTILAGIFSEPEIAEVQDFLTVGEYGLALDTLVDIIIEERKRTEPAIISLVNDLAIAMNLTPTDYTNRLQQA